MLTKHNNIINNNHHHPINLFSQTRIVPKETHSLTHYTGITSIFDVSSHLKTIPSRLAGKIHFPHWHPVVNGSGGGTIISTLSFLWTTPITLTVLPSFMYLQKHHCQHLHKIIRNNFIFFMPFWYHHHYYERWCMILMFLFTKGRYLDLLFLNKIKYFTLLLTA
jgi:hypothetical protein